MKQRFYSLTIEEIVNQLKTDRNSGLSSSEVFQLQKKYGKNIFKKNNDWGLLGRIISQFKSPLIFILLIAGFTALFLGEYSDSLVIFIALLINTLIGTFQENKASQAFDKLNESQAKKAVVIRGGKKSLVDIDDLVLGDIVVLDSGMYVPADIRIFEEKNLLVNESVLTGEWVGVPKTIDAIKTEKELPLGKRTNMVWMGSLVSSGFARGIVVSIGDNTEMGKIAKSLNAIKEEKTPIKHNIEKLSRWLGLSIIICLIVIFFLGIFRGEKPFEMILVAVSIAVAAIPEGLSAAVTSVLALGMWNILKKGGLVRNLLAAETLGSTTVILTDKTGTLTEAKMKLSEIFTAESFENKSVELDNGDNKEILKFAVISSDAFVDESEKSDELVVRGRPIEKALLMAGLEKGLNQDDLFRDNKRLDFLSFESKNGFSVSLNKNNDFKNNLLLFSGKPEFLLENSKYVYKNGKSLKLSDAIRNDFIKIQKEKSDDGMRIIAVAYKEVGWEKIPEYNDKNKQEVLDDLVFCGFLVFSDPVREDVRGAVKMVSEAGATVIMVTGDNPNTARKIAEDSGIIKEGGLVLTGKEIEKMNDGELLQELKKVRVFARILPEQKLRISKILQKNGEIIAMTGDGVNDAPALQAANIGIAVENGTEVAKEASDMVLLDSDFSVIAESIKEGRRIVDNLKKIVAYLLSTSFSEVFLIGGALLAGFPLPILPGQVLWSNIIEEGLMNFAFVFEPGESDLMKRDPRDSGTKTVLTDDIKKMIAIISIITGLFLIGLYYFLLRFDLAIEEVRTIMFVAVSLDSIFFTLSLKSLTRPIWKEEIFSNIYLIISLCVSVLLLLVAVFFNPIRDMLSLVELSHRELLFLCGVGLFNLILIELVKYFVFERRR